MPTFGQTGRKLTLDPTKKVVENHKDFQQVVHNMKIVYKNISYPLLKAAARHTHGRLIARSPIVTGAYVLSHKVGLNGKDSNFEPGVPLQVDDTGRRIPLKNRRSIVGRAIAAGQKVIQTPQKPTKFVLSNSNPYADKVEFIGWKNTRAYHVYGLTRLEMKEELKPIFSKIRKEIFELMHKVKKNKAKMKAQEVERYIESFHMAPDLMDDIKAETGMVSGYGESETGGAFGNDNDIVRKKK